MQAKIIQFLTALVQIASTIPKRPSVSRKSLMNRPKRMISNLWESLKKNTYPSQRLAGRVMELCLPPEQVNNYILLLVHLALNSSLCRDHWVPPVVGGLRGGGNRGGGLQHEHLRLPLGLRSLLQVALWRVQHSNRLEERRKLECLLDEQNASLLIFSINHISNYLSTEK